MAVCFWVYKLHASYLQNIVGHALYQLTVLFGILFFGDRFIPNTPNGRWAKLGSPPSKHFTIIFNAFVSFLI